MREISAQETLPNGLRRWTLVYTFTQDELCALAELDEFMLECAASGNGRHLYHTDDETNEAVEVFCLSYEGGETSSEELTCISRRLVLQEVITE